MDFHHGCSGADRGIPPDVGGVTTGDDCEVIREYHVAGRSACAIFV